MSKLLLVLLALPSVVLGQGGVSMGQRSAGSLSDLMEQAKLAGGGYSTMITVNKFGRNPDIDAGTEDVWSQGGTWVAPTAARVHAIVSSSAADTSAGTGARTVTLQGLDATYTQVSETVTLNGTTPVNTVNSYTFIGRMLVATAGSGATNAGTITATAATDATITIAMVIGKGQSQLAIYQVPAGYTAYCYQYGGGVNGAATANLLLELFAKPFGGVYNLKGSLNIAEAGTTTAGRNYNTPLVFTEKTTIKLSGTSDAGNSDVVGFFDLILILN